jgi:Aldehyde dehydrogenase family
VCIAGTRIFIEQNVHDEFVGRLVKHSETMTVGDPLHESSRFGPVVSKEQLDHIKQYLDIGKSEGARVAIGGEVVSGAGYFVRPTIFAGVHNQMRIAREEIFGPVGAAIPFKEESAAIFQGNDTNYGLAAAVWTRDVSRVHKVARWIEGRHRRDQLLRHCRYGDAFRWIQAVGLWPREREVCDRSVHADQVCLSETVVPQRAKLRKQDDRKRRSRDFRERRCIFALRRSCYLKAGDLRKIRRMVSSDV